MESQRRLSLIRCHVFITESTFGLPVYSWRPQAEVMADINQWWAENAANGIASVLSAYSLGKAQRISEHLDRNYRTRLYTWSRREYK